MKSRGTVQAHIVTAWRRCIEIDYTNQRINSERSLQAAMWSRLNAALPKRTRRLFIEPSFRIPTPSGEKRVMPDIVICNTKEVISVIELKYRPKAKPLYRKDIETLAAIARHRKQIEISNSRFRGSEKDATVYAMSKRILFVWAGVHAEVKSNQNALYSAGKKSLADCYMELHAVTRKNATPRVVRKR